MASKFVQIHVAAVPVKDTSAVNEYVYALDETGRAWRLDWNKRKWMPLPEDRES